MTIGPDFDTQRLRPELGKRSMTVSKKALNREEPVVLIVEDDDSLRRAIESLIRSAGYQSQSFSSASELFDTELPDTVRCLIADIRLPRSSGLDIQFELDKRGQTIPTIFMTGYGDIPMSVRAMKAGAIDFLAKPFRDQDVLDAVTSALATDRIRREARADLAELRAKHDTLTAREREVLSRIASGLLNKQVAGELGLSEITVKLHRSSLTRKMGARSFAELVRMFDALERDRLRR